MTTTPVPKKRLVPLHRANAVLTADRIDVRPSRSAALVPLAGFLLGGAAFAAIVLWKPYLPFFALVALLLAAMLLIPLAGLGLVYSVMGANVVVDRRKGSATWQQGFLGMGIGTTELVPFEKVAELVIRDPNATDPDGRAGPDQQLAQWEILVRKTSGKELRLGVVTVPRPLAEEGLARAREVGEALAEMTGRPLRAPEPLAEEEPAAAGTGRRRRRRGRRRR